MDGAPSITGVSVTEKQWTGISSQGSDELLVLFAVCQSFSPKDNPLAGRKKLNPEP
jgi:hypothetical protein